jgi:hypothetical protein
MLAWSASSRSRFHPPEPDRRAVRGKYWAASRSARVATRGSTRVRTGPPWPTIPQYLKKQMLDFKAGPTLTTRQDHIEDIARIRAGPMDRPGPRRCGRSLLRSFAASPCPLGGHLTAVLPRLSRSCGSAPLSSSRRGFHARAGRPHEAVRSPWYLRFTATPGPAGGSRSRHTHCRPHRPLRSSGCCPPPHRPPPQQQARHFGRADEGGAQRG